MAMNKRGIFFTVSAALLIGLALIAFVAFKSEPAGQQAIHTRVTTLDGFLRDAQRDMQRAFTISTFRGILALVQSVVETGEFVDDVNAAFHNAVINASYGNVTYALIENATMTEWADRLGDQAALVGIDLSVTFNSFSIQMNGPWTVMGTVNATIQLTDATGAAQFRVDQISTSEVSIIGFEDPLYAPNTLGRVTNIINQTPYSSFSAATLLDHAMEGYYIAHDDAPDYLLRLAGNVNSSANGIESLVDVEELSDNGVLVLARTAVDYLYWYNQSVSDCQVTGMPSWFYIDSTHEAVYDISSCQIS